MRFWIFIFTFIFVFQANSSCGDIITVYDGKPTWFGLDSYSYYRQAIKSNCDVVNTIARCGFHMRVEMSAINCSSYLDQVKALEAFLDTVDIVERKSLAEEAYQVAIANKSINSIKFLAENYQKDFDSIYSKAEGEFKIQLEILMVSKTEKRRSDFLSVTACKMTSEEVVEFYFISRRLLQSNSGDTGLRNFVKSLDSIRTYSGYQLLQKNCSRGVSTASH